jgi:hypothetical protein
MKPELQRILTDLGLPVVYGKDNDGEERQRDPCREEEPRMRCIFWKDLAKELKANGSKAVKGVWGQFANFEKTQPG